MLDGIKTALNANCTFTWADQEFLQQQSVRGWSELPVWVPSTGRNAGFMRVSVAKAIARGLTYRPLDITARDTLAWFKTLPAERQQNMGGLKAEKEQQVLAAFRAR
jgi:2'-hydroxyisoflavone reductase